MTGAQESLENAAALLASLLAGMERRDPRQAVEAALSWIRTANGQLWTDGDALDKGA